MFTRILRKDLKRKKGVNFILFLFIVIATVFLSASVNNMLVVTNATTYFMDTAKVPDMILSINYSGEDSELKKWLDEKKGTKLVKDYERTELLTLSDNDTNFDTRATIFISTDKNNYLKAFDQDGKEIKLKKGETTIPLEVAQDNNLKEGDYIKIKTSDGKKKYKIATIAKEVVYSGGMAGMVRLVFCEEDYKYLKEKAKITRMDQFEVLTDNCDQFERAVNNLELNASPVMISRSTISMLYSMDLVMAGMIAAIGLCLIIIAVLVLRFTIVFTIQEDYRQIGIMKVIGIKGRGIKGIYLIKYFAIVVAGALIGCIASFPAGNVMLASVSKRMLMEDSSTNGIFNILCSLFVVLFVMALCYLSMRKLNHMSAIDAIRNGSNGERFSKKSKMRLEKTKRMRTPLFMALNDIVSDFKSYIVLMLVFAIGIVLLTVPLNTLNTMRSSEMSDQFLMDRNATCFVQDLSNAQGVKFTTLEDYKEGINKAKKDIKSKGYDADISGGSLYGIIYKSDKVTEGKNILTYYSVDADNSYLTYLEGTAPKLENEIAMSQKSMDEMGLKIGDSVTARMSTGEKKFVITGSYQDYMQLGKSVRLNDAIDMKSEPIYTTWCLQVFIKGVDAENKEDVMSKLNKALPKYKFESAQDIVDKNVGGIVGMIESMKVWLVLLIAGINILITSLMMKMFMLREKGQIAILRSVGFRNWSIRCWQAIRIGLIMVVSLIVAIPLSRLMDVTVLKSIFGIMGAAIDIQVKPLEVYLLYPIILLVLIFVAAVICAGGVKKIDIREMNNVE